MQSSRVVSAAEFLGRSLAVRIMTTRRGDSTSVDLRVVPKQADDPIVERWRFGNEWAYPRVSPVWPLADVDPWEAISYSGPVPAAAKRPGRRPCPSCNATPSNRANYCAQCGSPLDDVEALAQSLTSRIGDPEAGSEPAAAALSALIARYAEKSFRFKQGLPELLTFVQDDFTAAASATFVRGEPARISPDLTLGAAQDIHQTIADTGRVLPAQIPHAELILRYAPLEFGYWGAFKALIKSVPVADMPDAYAEAIARISSKDWSRPAPDSVGIEDVGFLGEIVAAASPKTVKYLARRARRDLAELAKTSPDTYARIASRLILSWDRPLSRNSFAPAYVMLGAQSLLDAHGTNVVVDPDMGERRDAHPEIWDARLALVKQIFDGVTTSVEAKTWAYQVLDSFGRAPAISGDNTTIAMQSSYRPLQLAAFEAFTKRPAMWDKLATTDWAVVFRNAEEDTLETIFDVMTVRKYRPAAVEAARNFLLGHVPSTPRRRQQIAAMFLRATGKDIYQKTMRDPEGHVAAVSTLIAQSAAEFQKLWAPIIEALKDEDLKAVRRSLPETTEPSALELVDDLLIARRAEKAHPSEAITWIASPNPVEAKQGWQMLQRGDGVAGLLQKLPLWISRRMPDPSTLERIIPELVARAGLEDVSQLAAVAVEALKRGVDGSALVQLLTAAPAGRAVIWRVMATESGSDLAMLLAASPDALRLAGDDLTAAQLASATPGQCLVVLSYIKQNPERITRDVDFGVAAATSADPGLQEAAVSQLQGNGQMSAVWLTLAESAQPTAVAAAHDYVAGLTDVGEFRDAVLRCLDNPTPGVRAIGEQLLSERLERSEDPSLWNLLAESDDVRLVTLVASDPRSAQHVDDDVLSGLDRRVLLGGQSRRAREAVKSRLDDAIADQRSASRSRIATLLELARGDVHRDREWALAKLAELALAGVAIDGLEVSLVTTGEGA